MKRHHGAVGREWQRHLVNVGPDKIKAELHEHREAFLALPEVVAVTTKAHPQVRAVVNRFALHAAALRMAIAAGLLPWTVDERRHGHRYLHGPLGGAARQRRYGRRSGAGRTRGRAGLAADLGTASFISTSEQGMDASHGG